jgi:hypothetical protein
MNLQISKLAIGLALLFNISAAHAGDNGSYLKCSSDDRRTQVKINDDNGSSLTVEFTIDDATTVIREMVPNRSCDINDCESTPEVTNPEFEIVKYSHGLFTLNENSPMSFSISRQDAQPSFGDGRYLINGADPRNDKQIATPIVVDCKRIASPI